MAVRTTRVEASARILVVDDDPETARLVRTWFRGLPYDILDAPDGEQGLVVARRERPDIILLDLRMPGLDGHQVARALKSDATTHGIPIILLSACRSIEDKVEAFGAGVDDYVVKPFAFEEVDVRIRAMLGKRELYLSVESKNRELAATNVLLNEQLAVDEKTGLHTFGYFQRRLIEEWLRAQRYGTPLSLVMFDLDDFKRLNDTVGHAAGDVALRQFGVLVAGGARATDLAARWGGEEFVMVLPHTGGDMAARVAERIRVATREFVFLSEESPMHLTVSAGVATFPSHGGISGVDALVDAADRALYRAKERGKDQVVVDAGEASLIN